MIFETQFKTLLEEFGIDAIPVDTAVGIPVTDLNPDALEPEDELEEPEESDDILEKIEFHLRKIVELSNDASDSVKQKIYYRVQKVRELINEEEEEEGEEGLTETPVESEVTVVATPE